MMDIKQAILLLDNIDEQLIKDFIENEWVKPLTKQGTYYFDDIDLARITLINDLLSNMQVNSESVDIILSLLDQVYGLREQFRKVTKAIEKQPRSIQAEIFSILHETQG